VDTWKCSVGREIEGLRGRLIRLVGVLSAARLGALGRGGPTMPCTRTGILLRSIPAGDGSVGLPRSHKRVGKWECNAIDSRSIIKAIGCARFALVAGLAHRQWAKANAQHLFQPTLRRTRLRQHQRLSRLAPLMLSVRPCGLAGIVCTAHPKGRLLETLHCGLPKSSGKNV